MTTNRSATAASLDRAARRHRSRLGVGLAFVGLALVGLAQTGCRSDGCSTCGGFGSRLNSGVQTASANVQAFGARVFHPRRQAGGCSTCGTLGTVEEGVVVDSGVPVVVPGGTAIPAPGTILPAPPAGPIESAPSQLEAIPPPAAGSASNTPTSGRITPGASRSAYEASAPRGRNGVVASKKGSDLSRAYQTAPTAKAAYAAPDEPDIFDNLPPVDLPAELSRKVTPLDEPSGPPKHASPAPAGGGPEPDQAPLTLPDDPKTSSSPAEPASAGDRGVSGVVRAATTTRATIGMLRSAPVAPQVAGGSLPSAEGLAWLKEKGYRTLVDLRPRGEVEPNFPDQVTDDGMLYVAIPFPLDKINAARLARFNDLIGQADQRPVYFCDGDGRRAGLIWYLRLRSQDKEERTLARSKAEEIGFNPLDADAAEKFLKLNFAMEEPASLPVTLSLRPAAGEPDVIATSAVLPASGSNPSVAPTPTSSAALVSAAPLADLRPMETISQPSAPEWSDPAATWKPVAAIVLGGLGVPLAYWSKSSLGQRRGPRRASLTAKGPGPRKALPSSDA